MCAAADPANFEFEFGYKTVPGFNCNVWHRPPLPPAFKTPDGKEEYGVIADSFCMSRNPFDRLASQYRYRASVDAREAPPTCDAFSDFVDEHMEKLESNALLACLKRGVVAPTECQYHIRARLTRENKLSLDEIDDASSYGAEDCHFLPQTMYTRACETVFELEEYDAAVAPFLELQPVCAEEALCPTLTTCVESFYVLERELLTLLSAAGLADAQTWDGVGDDLTVELSAGATGMAQLVGTQRRVAAAPTEVSRLHPMGGT